MAVKTKLMSHAAQGEKFLSNTSNENISNQAIVEMTQNYLTPNYNRLPIAVAKGEGTWLYDVEGRKYLDFVTGLAVNALGHSHPRIVEAIRQAAGEILHCSNIYNIPSQARLGKILTELSRLDRVFFCNSGAEGNEAAIKIARRFAKSMDPQRYEIITLSKSFHGRTMATLTATGQEVYQKGYEPLLPGFVYARLNDLESVKSCINPHTAAIMLEPIQGEGGVNPCTSQFMQGCRQLCDQNGLLLILDEVQTGMGRTGKMFAFEHYQIKPDILVLAKALGGGLPIGAMLTRKEIASVFQPGSHASTFGGNPFVTKVALEVVQTMIDEDLPGKAALSGEKIKQFFAGLKKKYPDIIGDIRGKGLMIGVDLMLPASDFQKKALDCGLICNVIGGKTLRLLPPLNVTEDEIGLAMDIISQVISEFAS
jgi:acetylornithine/N-succinyldiaminopimelate aminotransferase